MAEIAPGLNFQHERRHPRTPQVGMEPDILLGAGLEQHRVPGRHQQASELLGRPAPEHLPHLFDPVVQHQPPGVLLLRPGRPAGDALQGGHLHRQKDPDEHLGRAHVAIGWPKNDVSRSHEVQVVQVGPALVEDGAQIGQECQRHLAAGGAGQKGAQGIQPARAAEESRQRGTKAVFPQHATAVHRLQPVPQFVGALAPPPESLLLQRLPDHHGAIHHRRQDDQQESAEHLPAHRQGDPPAPAEEDPEQPEQAHRPGGQPHLSPRLDQDRTRRRPRHQAGGPHPERIPLGRPQEAVDQDPPAAGQDRPAPCRRPLEFPPQYVVPGKGGVQPGFPNRWAHSLQGHRTPAPGQGFDGGTDGLVGPEIGRGDDDQDRTQEEWPQIGPEDLTGHPSIVRGSRPRFPAGGQEGIPEQVFRPAVQEDGLEVAERPEHQVGSGVAPQPVPAGPLEPAL